MVASILQTLPANWRDVLGRDLARQFFSRLHATAVRGKFHTKAELDETVKELFEVWKERGGPPPERPRVKGEDGRLWTELTLSGEP